MTIRFQLSFYLIITIFLTTVLSDQIVLQQGKNGYTGFTDTFIKKLDFDESENFIDEEILESAH